MLELHEALAVAAGPLVEDIDRLTHEDSLAGLAEVKAAQVRLAERLLADSVPAPEIQALIADINNDIHRRVLRLLEAELAGEGRGRRRWPTPASSWARVGAARACCSRTRTTASSWPTIRTSGMARSTPGSSSSPDASATRSPGCTSRSATAA